VLSGSDDFFSIGLLADVVVDVVGSDAGERELNRRNVEVEWTT